MEVLPAARHAMLRGVQGEVAQAVDPVRVDMLGTPQQRPHSREQLGQVEGLGEIVVRSGIEARHPLAHLPARGQDEDRHRVTACPQATRHIESIDVWQPQVEDEQGDAGVALRCLEAFQCVMTGAHGLDVIALEREHPLEHLSDRGIVVNDEDGHDASLDIAQRAQRRRRRAHHRAALPGEGRGGLTGLTGLTG